MTAGAVGLGGAVAGGAIVDAGLVLGATVTVGPGGTVVAGAGVAAVRAGARVAGSVTVETADRCPSALPPVPNSVTITPISTMAVATTTAATRRAFIAHRHRRLRPGHEVLAEELADLVARQRVEHGHAGGDLVGGQPRPAPLA